MLKLLIAYFIENKIDRKWQLLIIFVPNIFHTFYSRSTTKIICLETLRIDFRKITPDSFRPSFFWHDQGIPRTYPF